MAEPAPIAPQARSAQPARTAQLASRIPEILGWLALLTALALLSPGLTVVASAEPAGASGAVSEAGPSCEAGQAGSEARVQQLEEVIENLRQLAAAQPDATGDGYVALGNSGFSYRHAPPAPTPDADPGR